MSAIFKFRLYIAGQGPNSLQALANLSAVGKEYLPGRHEIEVVDVLKDQQRALKDGVMLTPLLVKLSPAPVRKIVGNLSQREAVVQALNLPPPTP